MSTPDTPESPEEADQPSRVVRAIRLLTSPAALLQATGFLVLVAIGIGAAWLLPPSNAVGELPEDDALGTASTVFIKANRDYTIPDQDATLALRNEAARQVRSVYDFDVGSEDEARARVSGAFSAARDALTAALAAQPPKRTRARKGESPDDDAAVAAAQTFHDEFIKHLQTVIDEPEYEELAKLRFSESLENAVIKLTGVLAGEIAPSRELLSAERGNGITIRRVGAPLAHGETEVRDVEHIPDLTAVKLDLQRIASGLGEMPGSNSGVGRAALVLPPDLDPAVRRTAALLAALVVTPNMAYNAEETEARKVAAAAAVKPVVLQYARGEKILGEGERIEKRHLLVFHFMREQARVLDSLQIRSGAVIFTILLVVAAFSLARRTVRRFRPTKRDLVFLAATLLGNLAALRAGLAGVEALHNRPAWLTSELAVLVLPLAGGTMLVRMLRSGESAVVYALVIAPLTALQLNSHIPAAVSLVASLVAANRLGGRVGRSALPAAALEAGAAATASVMALALFNGRMMRETLLLGVAAFVGGAIVSPLAAALIAPLLEPIFGYISESRLVRLSNLNHPALKELIIRAPGTYHHSLIVGALAESAARKVGAHPLLARVGGYYHDLGKADAPLMFGENQKSENRLEKLPPEEAAAVLRKHVADGVARAEAAHLPRVIIDFIIQHHGDAATGSFYEVARASAERDGRPLPDEREFHYPGPRPRSREIALVLLADAVEAASRTLPDATEERLHSMVVQVVQEVVRRGQLNECDLTLADILLATGAFQKTLVEMHSLSRVDVLPTLRPPGVPPPERGEATVLALR